MPSASEQQVERALAFVQKAWKAVCEDYKSVRLNSESSLQAAFYHQFRKASKDAFRVYTSVKVDLPTAEAGGTSDKPFVFVDTLVCTAEEVLLAVELKYAPRSKPQDRKVQKDLHTLGEIRGRIVGGKRFSVSIERHGFEVVPLAVTKHTKLVFGAFLNARAEDFDVGSFWESARPAEGRRWSARAKTLPPRLGLCLAFAHGAEARPGFFGAPFGDCQGLGVTPTRNLREEHASAT